MNSDDFRPTRRQLTVLRRMREGHRLAYKKSAYAVAQLGNGDEVAMSTVTEMADAGWIYEISSVDKERVWGLTRGGLEMLERQ